MSELPIDPLPPEIEDLLALERDGYPEDLALKDRVANGVERIVLGAEGGGGGGDGGGESAALGGGARAASGAGVGKIVALASTGAFIAGIVAGALGMRAIDATSPAAPSSPSAAAAAVVFPGAGSIEAASAPPAFASASAKSEAIAVDAGAKIKLAASEARSGADLVREREIVDAARAALARGRPDDALAAVARHQRQWPRGQLTEEREVVAIQALVTAGRRADAEHRAAKFRRDFRDSVLVPAVDAALASP